MMNQLESDIKAIRKEAKLRWFHWFVVAFSLSITLFAWQVSKRSVEAKNAQEFYVQASQVVQLVSERMKKYEDGLWGGVAAIQAIGGDIDYFRWKKYANALQIDIKYPGINGIGVIHYVAPERLESYMADQREDRPNYKIHPAHDKNEYWPISYIEPVGINAKAVGLDMAHENNRYLAATRARDTGKAQITGPITLVQDKSRTPGFLFYAPFYKSNNESLMNKKRDNFTGLVYAPFVVNKLMLGTLHKENRKVGIKIIDGDEVLYNEHTPIEAKYDPDPMFSDRFELDLYGRTWVFDIRSDLSFRQATDNQQPLLVLIGGIILDALLLTLFILLSNANKRALDILDRVTKEENV